MTKARKPSFEPSTVPIRNGDYQAWLNLVFSTAKDAGEWQMKLQAGQLTAAPRIAEARAVINKAAADAARAVINKAAADAARKRSGGAGEAA